MAVNGLGCGNGGFTCSQRLTRYAGRMAAGFLLFRIAGALCALRAALAAEHADARRVAGWAMLAMLLDPLELALLPFAAGVAMRGRTWALLVPLVATGLLALQASGVPQLEQQAPGLWALIGALPGGADWPLLGLALAATIGAGAWLTAHVAGERLAPSAFPARALAALLLPALAPMSGATALLPAIVLAARYDPPAALLLALATLGAGTGAPALGAVATLAAAALLFRPTRIANDNAIGLPPFGMTDPQPSIAG